MTTSASKSGVPDPYPILLNGLVVITIGLLLMLSPIGFRYTWAQTGNLDIGKFSVQLNDVTLGDSFKWTLQAIVAPERLRDNLPMYGYELNKDQVTRIEDVYGEIVKRFGQYKVADGITNINTVSPEPAPADWYVGIADKECGTSVSAIPLLYSNNLEESNEELVGRCFMSSKPIHRVIDEEIPDPIKRWVSRENWVDSYNQAIDELFISSFNSNSNKVFSKRGSPPNLNLGVLKRGGSFKIPNLGVK